ncbi:hypothetical protein [uncultured Porphyromonas sp.]|uniref:hypothetical protein n=1 Tax=uncultured Porphyromonas sp. TaxID=159274 RepID=UPI002619AA8E|nr:hypothetical protein [uncultured Porphyromonas sp.]
MKQYNSTTLVRTIWSLLLAFSALCLIPTTAEAQLSVRSNTRVTIKGFPGGTGQVRLTLSGGKAPYTVKLTAYPPEYTGKTLFTSQKEETIIYNLPKGSYELEVSDANGTVKTVSRSVGEKAVGLNGFDVNAKWSQLHTSETNPSRWLSTRIFETVPRYYSTEIDSIAKYFDIAICVSYDYYYGYKKGQKDLNWLDLKEAKKAPTFEGEYGCWLVQDPVYDNGKPTGQTVQRSHLFIKVPDDSPSPDELYYNAGFALPFDDKEKIGIAIRVKGSDDPKNSYYANAQDLFDAKESADPNPWIEMVGEGKDEPCEGYKPTFALKKDVVEKMNLQFPVKVKSRRTEITFADRNDTTPRDLGALYYNSDNRIYMRDASGKESSMGFRPGKPATDIADKVLQGHWYYSDSKPERMWDEESGWRDDPEADGPGVRDYCTGEVRMVPVLSLQEVHFDKPFKTEFAQAEVTLVSAPQGYNPQNKYFPVLGEAIEVSGDYESALFFPFPSASAPAHNPYMKPYFDVKVPEGKYKFEVSFFTLCGEWETETVELNVNYQSVKYEISDDAKDLKPQQFEKVDCKTMRVYPFRGAKSSKILLRNGKPIRVYASVVQKTRPEDHPKQYVTTITSTSVDIDPNNMYDSPDNRYVDLPWTSSNIEIKYNYERSWRDSLPCIYESWVTFTVEATPPTYDPEHLYTYICKSGETAYVSVLPIHTVGATLVELRDVKDKNKLYASETLPATKQGGSVEFNLTGDKIQPEYSLYIRTGTDKCPLDNGGEIIKMNDLRGSSFIIGAANTKYCVGDTIKLECPPVTPESKYTWIQPDGTEHSGRKVIIGVADLPLSGKWQLKVTAVPCDGTPAPQTVPFMLSVAPPELWWSEKAKSADWNSFDNWVDKKGKPANAIPAKCTDVHLPAVVDKFYPNLDPNKPNGKSEGTEWEPLGEPVCNDIYFHFGSALGQPQLLTNYSRAFIDYNFGMAQSDGTIKKLEDPNHPKAYDRILERDRWYMIATPLKNVYTGDFSLAGYPLTYQRYLKVKFYGERPKEASFDIPMNKLGRPMVAYNHALAYKVEGYHSGKKGADDHKNLDGLDGIIRLPYYENKDRAPYYPLHRYYEKWYWYKTDSLTNISTVTDSIAEPRSYFAYFDLNTLKPVTKVDSVKRDTKLDYRFLYEDDKTNAIGRTRASTGKPAGEGSDIDWVEEEIEGYTMMLTSSSKSDKYVIVGNPFMSPISADQFFEVNKNNITRGIYIFENGAWRHYGDPIPNSTASDELKTIPPLQAFMVMLRLDGTPNVYFPTAPEYSVLVDPNSPEGKGAVLRSTDEGSSKEPERYVAVKVTDAEGGYTSAVLLPEDTEESIPALIAPEGMQTAPLVYFISPTDSSCNFVQTNVPSAVVELGVFAPTDGMLTLDFTTLAETPFDKLALYDRLRGTEQDLLVNPTYSYGYSERDGRRFELRMSYGNVRYEEQQDHQPDLAIERTATGYRISYDQGIAGYQLYSVHGYLLERATTDGQTQVDIEMPETEVVLLDVQSADGLRWIKKLQR